MKYLILPFVLILLLFSCKKMIVNKTENKEVTTTLRQHFRPDSSQVMNYIAFGSCSNQRLEQKYWSTIISKQPDLWIWSGDIIYSDTENMEEHKKEYDIMKNNPQYQKFIGQIPVIGVWDDHDYGVNDGDISYPQKVKSKELLLNFLDISTNDKINNHEGMYTSYVYGKGHRKVKVFLLDNRYFKDKLKKDSKTANRYLKNTSGSVLGKEQWQWLENEIKNSQASINIFVSGLQIIADDHIYEKWGDFPNERLKFLKLLEKYKVKNPVIISGDRHFAELSEYTYEDFSANVTEITSSGLTHSY